MSKPEIESLRHMRKKLSMFKKSQKEFTCDHCSRTMPVEKAVLFDYNLGTIKLHANGDIHCVDCWLKKDKNRNKS